jgi:hypothetical protein
MISTTLKHELSSSFFPVRQGAKRNSHHSHPGQPKTVTTPEIIDQIYELVIEDHWILAKSIAEQLGIQVSGLGPSFMKIWTCRSSPQSGS